MSDPQDSGPRPATGATGGARETRNVPPLVWIVVLLLIALAAYAYFGRQKEVITPHGEAMGAVSSSAPAPAPGG